MDRTTKKAFVFAPKCLEQNGREDFIFHLSQHRRFDEIVKQLLDQQGEKLFGWRLTEAEMHKVVEQVAAELFRQKEEEWFGPRV